MRQLRDTPASTQLQWFLDALEGSAVESSDVERRLSSSFLARFDPSTWLAMMAAQAPALRPFDVLAVEVTAVGAKARLQTPVGEVLCTCTTDGDGLIEMLNVQPAAATGLTPRLPMTFTSTGGSDHHVGHGLVVVSGVPGTGKSTLADEVGRRLSVPVFALDWLLGALTPFGGRSFDRLGEIGEELLTTLAYRQLRDGLSAIIDTPAENVEMRVRWETMAAHFGAAFRVVLCVCGDDDVHRQRLSSRVRGIPGWHDGGNWDVVKPRRDAFPSWDADHLLVLDAVQPASANADKAVRWLAGE